MSAVRVLATPVEDAIGVEIAELEGDMERLRVGLRGLDEDAAVDRLRTHQRLARRRVALLTTLDALSRSTNVG